VSPNDIAGLDRVGSILAGLHGEVTRQALLVQADAARTFEESEDGAAELVTMLDERACMLGRLAALVAALLARWVRLRVGQARFDGGGGARDALNLPNVLRFACEVEGVNAPLAVEGAVIAGKLSRRLTVIDVLESRCTALDGDRPEETAPHFEAWRREHNEAMEELDRHAMEWGRCQRS
jgi:hypothetical protein